MIWLTKFWLIYFYKSLLICYCTFLATMDLIDVIKGCTLIEEIQVLEWLFELDERQKPLHKDWWYVWTNSFGSWLSKKREDLRFYHSLLLVGQEKKGFVFKTTGTTIRSWLIWRCVQRMTFSARPIPDRLEEERLSFENDWNDDWNDDSLKRIGIANNEYRYTAISIPVYTGIFTKCFFKKSYSNWTLRKIKFNTIM